MSIPNDYYRNWYVQGSGQGYYAAFDQNVVDVVRVGPFSTEERAQEYIDAHANDTPEDIRAYQFENFETEQNNG